MDCRRSYVCEGVTHAYTLCLHQHPERHGSHAESTQVLVTLSDPEYVVAASGVSYCGHWGESKMEQSSLQLLT